MLQNVDEIAYTTDKHKIKLTTIPPVGLILRDCQETSLCDARVLSYFSEFKSASSLHSMLNDFRKQKRTIANCTVYVINTEHPH